MNVLSGPPKIQNQHPLMFPSPSSFSKFRFIISPNVRGLCTIFRRSKVRVTVAESVEMKENWLESLSCPFEQQDISLLDVSSSCKERKSNEEGCLEKWVIGIDPDIHGALALLKDSDGFGVSSVSAEVFDTPHLRVMVGKKVRKRLDARSIVQLLHGLGAPQGTTAYIEQSSPCPQDGKLGWWSGGFTYGLWIGILVSSGFTVVPISSRVWKDHFQLFRNSSSKDDSRSMALDLFPSLSSSLKRKKDHGRAEALLIAAYGMGIKIQPKAFETVINDTAPPTVLSMQETAIAEHLIVS